MKTVLFSLCAVFSAILLRAETPIWDAQNSLGEWRALRNVKAVYEDGVLKLSDIGRDPQLVSPKINLDASAVDSVSITYRGWDLPADTAGQLYFSHGTTKFGASD